MIRRAFAAYILFCLMPDEPASAQECRPCVKTPTMAELRKMDRCALEATFVGGTATCMPRGSSKGTILQMYEGRHPRFKAFYSGVLWRGKLFRADGTMTNRWLVGKGVESGVTMGDSWSDGAPAVVIDYPTDVAMFGNTRDELRRIGPGLWMGKFYERLPTPRLRGYFVLEFAVE